MSILLSIIESPENCAITESSKTFGEQGGTIGRGTENYWVLNDPECFLSSQHSQISFENGVYVLTDLSTNGTFLNGSREPMGKGNQVQLQDGDEIELSDYKFRINIWQSESGQASTNSPFSEPEPQNFEYGDPFATAELPSEVSSIEPLLSPIPEETDPLAALDNVKQSFNSKFDSAPSNTNLFTSNINSHSDQSDIINQAIDWPNSTPDAGLIPENWYNVEEQSGDAAITNEPSEPVQVTTQSQNEINQVSALQDANNKLRYENKKIKELQEENDKLKNELNTIKQRFIDLQKRTSSLKNAIVDTTMITAMGLTGHKLDKQQVIEINQLVGEMVRETVAGMMQVLSARSSIKNEFRMNVTTIQPVENNPLKFSANVDDALENMFLKKGSSYKKPVEAIQDGFHGIGEHQVAILAGIRAAFKGTIERFEPYSLESRFERQNKSYLDVMPVMKKAKNWEQFIFYYNDLVQDLDNSFQYLFGDEFVQAYEDQLQRLANARISKT